MEPVRSDRLDAVGGGAVGDRRSGGIGFRRTCRGKAPQEQLGAVIEPDRHRPRLFRTGESRARLGLDQSERHPDLAANRFGVGGGPPRRISRLAGDLSGRARRQCDHGRHDLHLGGDRPRQYLRMPRRSLFDPALVRWREHFRYAGGSSAICTRSRSRPRRRSARPSASGAW